jgi:23S rRNA (pseudouridine1915-N3)-methyltransferase
VARELLIVWAGRHRRSAWDDLCAGYRRRIARVLPVRDLPVRSRRAGQGRERRRAEGEALLGALPRPCFTVALDRGGELASSEELARRFARRRREWPHAMAFVVGSDLGLDPAVLEAARERWSLGPLTLPHELARLVLYEQLYRALSIEAGIDYHRPSL